MARLSKSDREFFKRMHDAIDTLDEAPYHDYWSALGKFIHTFSATEHKLLLLLRKYAGLKDRNAGIIFSGTRGEQASTWIKAILESAGRRAIKDRLESPLAQFAAINTIRNNVVHWGARYDRTKKNLLVSNKKLTPMAGKTKEFPISVADLEFMIADLRLVHVLFDVELYGRGQNDGIAMLIGRSWLYKPPQPFHSQKSIRRGPKGRKPRRPS